MPQGNAPRLGEVGHPAQARRWARGWANWSARSGGNTAQASIQKHTKRISKHVPLASLHAYVRASCVRVCVPQLSMCPKRACVCAPSKHACVPQASMRACMCVCPKRACVLECVCAPKQACVRACVCAPSEHACLNACVPPSKQACVCAPSKHASAMPPRLASDSP